VRTHHIAALLICLCLRAQAQTPAAKLVGYFPQWALYNQPRYLVKDLVTSGSINMLDQLNYAQGFVTNGRCSIADPNADLNTTFTAAESVTGRADSPKKPFRGYLHQLAELKRKHPRLKLLISLEGRASDFAFDAQPEHRKAFVDSCIDIFVKGNLAPGIRVPHLFDGIDVDWEYPHGADSANFLALLTELRQRMNAVRPSLMLTIAVGPSPRMYEGTDMAAVARTVDQVGLMTYDFNGPWSDHTGFVAQLSSFIPGRGGSVERTVTSYIASGVPAEKLLIGVPFYGYGWHLVPDIANGLEQEGEPIRGDHPYRDIEAIAVQSKLFRDPVAQTPWLFDGDAFWTFDDPLSVAAKAAYAQSQHLGGLMFWELSQDTAEAHLLHAAHNCLKRTSPPAQQTALHVSVTPALEAVCR
jgi:chitinase